MCCPRQVLKCRRGMVMPVPVICYEVIVLVRMSDGMCMRCSSVCMSEGMDMLVRVGTDESIGYDKNGAGYHHRKTPGAVAAALGVVSPSVIIITVIAMFLAGFKDNVFVQHALSAISVCVVALIVDAVIGMWKKGVKDILGVIICLCVLALSLFTKISPVLLVIACAVIGIVSQAVRRAAKAETETGGDRK